MSYNQLNVSFKWFYLYFKQHPNFLGHDVVLVSRCSDDGNLLYLGHSSLCDYGPPFTRLAFPLCVYTLRSDHISVNRFFDEVTRKHLQDNKCWIRRNIVPWFVSPLSYDSDLTKFQMCWLVRVGHWEQVRSTHQLRSPRLWLLLFLVAMVTPPVPSSPDRSRPVKMYNYTWSCHKAWKQTLFDVWLRVVAGTPRWDKICVRGILHPD